MSVKNRCFHVWDYAYFVCRHNFSIMTSQLFCPKIMTSQFCVDDVIIELWSHVVVEVERERLVVIVDLWFLVGAAHQWRTLAERKRKYLYFCLFELNLSVSFVYVASQRMGFSSKFNNMDALKIQVFQRNKSNIGTVFTENYDRCKCIIGACV